MKNSTKLTILAAALAVIQPLHAYCEELIYRNSRWGFCLYYPMGWPVYEGINQAGVRFDVNTDTVFSFGALPGGSLGEWVDGRSSLRQSMLNSRSEFSQSMAEAPRKIMYSEVRKITFRGFPAVTQRISYEYRGKLMMERDIWVETQHEIFSFTAQCAVSNRKCYLIFDRLLKRFAFRCNS
jgi:hypothetical protein